MTFTQLKLLALACMLFDHLTRIFPPSEALLPLAAAWEAAGHPAAALWLLEDVPLYLACIGRLAAPIFLFCTANGFVHTHNVRAYLRRLLVTAVIAQPFYVLFDLTEQRLYGLAPSWQDCGLNILFTLALGLAALAVFHRCADLGQWLLGLLAVVCAAGLARMLRLEGKEGYILLIFTFYLTRGQGRVRRGLVYLPATALSRWGLVRWALAERTAGAVVNCTLNTFGNYLGTLVTLAYNGEKGSGGRHLQWAFYAFYPAHFALLALAGHLRPPF